ncbi:hypothetical protein N3K66_002616 [Trichothecium roseum]|uniref:Uncharacterized protein n=1 Tax=Trichothecium roseum TaxID=47278 RepID=A0ACC0VA48_9HYPO|nr:hypothetical protein N3K66_002616 [Trichothecium roseum]
MVPDQGGAEGPVESRRRKSLVGGEHEEGEGHKQTSQAKQETDNISTTQGNSKVSPRLPIQPPRVSTTPASGTPLGTPRLNRKLEPPVTRATLSELDTGKIVHNSKLRHDINYDPELHFRPNMDGEKGRKKNEKAQQFWETLREQLSTFVCDRPKFDSMYGTSDTWCLPVLLKNIKEILQTLVPQRDREVLDEGFNVGLLMQQFYRGVADLDNLSSWLARVLKSHCAPMRDEWVDRSCDMVSSGNRNLDLDMLVNGLKDLLSVLESMKLDVANHQIRCLRPLLIEDTVHFETKYYKKKIDTGKLQVTRPRHWYKIAKELSSGSALPGCEGFGDMSVFFEALVNLVLPSANADIPSTFQHDYDRVMKIRADLLDTVNLDICMRMYEDISKMGRMANASLQGKNYMETSASRSSLVLDAETNASVSSRPSSLVLSTGGSASSSPRSSFLATTEPSAMQDEEIASPEKVRNDLVALLQHQQTEPSCSQASKWKLACSSIAIQIHREAKAPMGMLSIIEDKLMSTLCNFESPTYLDVEQTLHSRLLTELGERVGIFKGLSPLNLFTFATGARIPRSNSSRQFDVWLRDVRREGSVEDMATRLAHLGILHWRVWSGLAYLDQVNDGDST